VSYLAISFVCDDAYVFDDESARRCAASCERLFLRLAQQAPTNLRIALQR
jgi:hypothetical protein